MLHTKIFPSCNRSSLMIKTHRWTYSPCSNGKCLRWPQTASKSLGVCSSLKERESERERERQREREGDKERERQTEAVSNIDFSVFEESVRDLLTKLILRPRMFGWQYDKFGG